MVVDDDDDGWIWHVWRVGWATGIMRRCGFTTWMHEYLLVLFGCSSVQAQDSGGD